ncbi:MAG TPA: YihY/virulence factor BrkB family protein [Gaiellaceae bacterium]|nr:YihY/virulence factor BrkB family protein [Gaiellaceae bacterium]
MSTLRERWWRARDLPVLLARGARAALADDAPLFASAVAYSAFLAVPATLLLLVGAFSLLADASAIEELMDTVGAVLPGEAVTLLRDSLLQLERRSSTGLLMTAVGLGLALWTATGAVGALMTAINRAHGVEDTRGFARRRAAALLLVVALGSAVVLVTGLLVLGPHLERWLGGALGAETPLAWVWWTAQWPILLAALFGSFAVVYALAADRRSRHWRIVSPGALVATAGWLLASGGFALYAAGFGSYNKAWGSLSAAIVTLVWLWLSALVVLLGAAVNAEAERVAAARARGLSGSGERSPAPRARRAA